MLAVASEKARAVRYVKSFEFQISNNQVKKGTKMARKKESREFVVKGPYPLQFNEKGMLDNAKIAQFFGQDAVGFSSKHGVYVFARKHGTSYMPFYVGMTTNSFKTEIFNPGNKRNFESIFRERKGRPVLFLLVPSDEVDLPVEKVKKVSKTRQALIAEIEEFFIKLSACVNPGLQNKQKAKGPEWSIKGVLNAEQGRPDNEASTFKSMFKDVDWTWTPPKDKVVH